MKYSIICAAVILFCIHAGSGQVKNNSKLCSKSDFDTDEGYVNCVRNRKFKRQVGGHVPDQPCNSYITISSLARRTGNTIDSNSSPLCDRGISSKWIRFMSHAGGKIPETCPPVKSCGTVWPIYMREPHPSRPYEETVRTVCVNEGSCCSSSWTIKVVNCVNFYVYQLISPPRCYMSYCAGEEAPCPEGSNSETGFTPSCTANYPHLTGKVSLTPSTADTTVKFFCHYKGVIPSDSLLLVDWYVAGDKSSDVNGFERPIWTDELLERRRSELTEGRWITRMGSTIFCRLRAKWKNGTGVPSKYIESQKYFAGIKVLHRVVNVSEAGGVALIQLQSTVPIKCYPEFSENCKIIVEVDYNPGHSENLYYLDQQAVFGDCSVEITSENWQDVHNITVKAVRDFKRDGNKRMIVEFKPIFTTVASYMWNDYRLPDVEIITTDALTGVCQSYGDPHLITFDGLQYHVFLEGEFVLYQNTRYQMKIHARLERCEETATCNCGLAVAVNDDVIVVDRCLRQKRNVAFGESFPEGWNTLHKHALEQGVAFVRGLRIFEHNDGRKYTIHTPTGSYLNFDIGEKWVRIDFYASSDDYRSTVGLCGTFDENALNDFTMKDRKTVLHARHDAACGEDQDVCRFAEEYRVKPEDSLFGDKVNLEWKGARILKDERYCTCRQNGKSSEVTCDYQKEISNPESRAEQEDGVDRTGEIIFIGSKGSARSRRSVENNEFDDYFDFTFNYNESFHGHLPGWPTKRGITEHAATKKCYEAIYNNGAAISCLSLFSDKEMKNFHHSCVTDVKVSGGFEWIQSSLEPFISKCINKIYLNSSLWQSTNVPSQNAPVTEDSTQAHELLKGICPSSCSNRGTCINRHCHCKDGFEGVDCGIDSSTIPKNLRLAGFRTCDRRASNNCQNISVVGSNFLKTDDITCNFVQVDGPETITSSVFMTFEKLSCPLPSLSSPFAKYELRIVITDKTFSHSLGRFLHFDSKCARCSEDDMECSLKDNTCSIDGICFGKDEVNPDSCCEICSPEISKFSFVKRAVPQFSLSPPGGELNLENCNVTGRKLIKADPDFDCGFKFDVQWTGDSCQSLLGFSIDGATVLGTVKKCKKINCQFHLTATPKCSDQIFEGHYLLNVPDDIVTSSDDCHVEEVNRTSIEWKVSAGETEKYDFSQHDTSDPPFNYYIIKQSSNDFSIDQNGEITYKAPGVHAVEEIMVVAEKHCMRKIYTKMFIIVE